MSHAHSNNSAAPGVGAPSEQQAQRERCALAPGSPLNRIREQLWRYENCAERFCDNAADVRELLASRDAWEARAERAEKLGALWQQMIDDTERVIQNPEANHRAGVLEINRLRTVNAVRREMLTELRAALANK